MTSLFPQFSLLPAELRIQIWKLALLPPPKISTLSLSYTRWDPLDHRAYDRPSFEVAQGTLWFFAFTPCQNLPAILFTSREAFSVGQRYYHIAHQIGHEIVDKTVLTKLTTVDDEIIVEDYSSYMPATRRTQRAIPYSTNDLIHVAINPIVTLDKDLPLAYHAISDLHPLAIQGIRYLVIDAMEFYNRMYVMKSNSLMLAGLEVLYLVMGRYDDTREVGWETPDDGALDMWDFLKPWERLDLEAGTAKWNVGKVVFVGSVEEALEKVGGRDI
jgi:2EXR family